MNQNERLQALIQLYKQEVGVKSFDVEKITEWAISRGVSMPRPKSPRAIFASQLADAARAEYRVDGRTGLAYRANHAVRNIGNDGKQYTLWIDIEDATRPQMHYSLSNRRQQMVGDAVHLKIDESIWNDRHPDEDPIQLIMDFTDDVEERRASPGFADDAAA